MREAEISHSREERTIDQPSPFIINPDAEMAARALAEAKLLREVRQRNKSTTSAEHKAIYESSARDIAAFIEREGQDKAR